MATIGLPGSYGGLNIGDEAILTAVLASSREAVPFAEVVVFSRDAAECLRHVRRPTGTACPRSGTPSASGRSRDPRTAAPSARSSRG
jgi:polysaccharide pyruvyl transferase WcaK-like protein